MNPALPGAIRDRIPRARLLASLMDTADDAIFVKSPDGTIMSWNAGAERMYGYLADEIVGTSVARLAPPDRASDIPTILKRLAAGERIERHRTVRMAKDGRLLDVSLGISQIRDSRGRIIGASAVAREITADWLADVRAAERSLLELVPAAVVGIDAGGLVRLWNAGATDLFGWAPDDVIGRPVSEDLVSLFRDEPIRTEVAVRRRDGSSADVLAAAFPMRRDVEGVVSRVAIALDITAHRRASAALQEREAAVRRNEGRFQALVTGADVPMVIQRNGAILQANRAFAALFGVEHPEQLMAVPIVELVAAAEPAPLPASWAAHPDVVEALGDVEMVGRRADGSTFPVLVKRTAVELLDGPATLALLQDLTAEKRAQAERDWLVAAVEQTADMIVLSDIAGRILSVNGSTTRATGRERAELIGAPLSALGGVLDESGTSASAAEGALATGSSWSGSLAYVRADGTVFDADVSIEPVHDAVGTPVAMLTIGHDVTVERTLEAQLRQSQKMEAVGQLAGGVAHDFNNLLTAIRGYAELIRFAQSVEAAEVLTDADEIIANVDRATMLTRQLLAFSRRQVVRPQVLDPAAIVAGISALLRRLLGEGVTIHTVSRGAGLVYADPAQLEQVIVNLALNGRDAMGAGGRLTIETDVCDLDEAYALRHAGSVPGRHLMLAVHDSGVGMDAETQRHIFEPFFTTKPVGEGTGLGLPTVSGIVTRAGGSIEVASELGQGTSVKVFLPLVEGPATPRRAAIERPLPGGTERILLVEDDDAVRNVAVRVLRKLGYTVLEAAGGHEAASLLAADPEPVHLLLTDMVMPNIGGWELATNLIALQPSLRVLFMSGYPDDHLHHIGGAAHAVAHLAKPFTSSSLAQAVRDCLDELAEPAGAA